MITVQFVSARVVPEQGPSPGDMIATKACILLHAFILKFGRHKLEAEGNL